MTGRAVWESEVSQTEEASRRALSSNIAKVTSGVGHW